MSQLGRPEDGTDPTLTNNLEFFVKLKPPDEWPADIDDARRRRSTRWTARLAEIPGHRGQLLAADPRQRQREHLRPVRPDRAQDLRRRPRRSCRTSPSKAKAAIADVPGVADLGIVKSGEVPQVQRRARPRGARPLRPRHGATSSTSSRRRSAASRSASSGRASGASTSSCASRPRRATTSRRSASCASPVPAARTVPLDDPGATSTSASGAPPSPARTATATSASA